MRDGPDKTRFLVWILMLMWALSYMVMTESEPYSFNYLAAAAVDSWKSGYFIALLRDCGYDLSLMVFSLELLCVLSYSIVYCYFFFIKFVSEFILVVHVYTAFFITH